MWLWAIIYSHDRSTYFAVLGLRTDHGNIKIAPSYMNVEIWERGRAVSFLGTFVSNFRYSAFAVIGPVCQTGLLYRPARLKNRFLGSLKGLQIRTQDCGCVSGELLVCCKAARIHSTHPS
jgi:hypothetical protein